MTREEKINTLKAIIQECEDYQWQRKETLFEIIKDLEQKPCEDAVSRQAVLDLVNSDWKYEGLETDVASLPPVTPKQIECEDAISRSDAVRVASGYCHPANIAKELEKLPPVTPIRPKGHWLSVHTGKPSHLKDGMAVESIKCSECGEWLTASDEYACNGNYCPNCGCRMIEPQESEE